MPSEARLILPEYKDFGWGVSSPDHPHLVGGVASPSELTDEYLFGIAKEAGLDEDGSIECYLQLVFVIEDEAYVARGKQDHFIGEREQLVNQIIAHVSSDPELRHYATRDSIGDAVFIACRQQDLIKTASGSLEADEPVTFAVNRHGRIEYLKVTYSPNPQSNAQSLADMGFTLESMIEELFARQNDGADLGDISHPRALAFA